MPVKKAIFNVKNILVVGGAGFIGQHLCKDLLEHGRVICLDNFSTGDNSNIAPLLQHPNFRFVNYDIVNPLNLEALGELEDFHVEFQGVQEIYYLASPASPKQYERLPIETLQANSVGLRNALDFAVKYKAKFIYASSAAVYGPNTGDMKIKESYVGPVDQLSPRSIFAEAKRFGETLVWAYRKNTKIDAKIARLFNCYGSGMRLDDGRMIPELIKAAVEHRDLEIYGEPAEQSGFIYVDDLVKGIIKLMDSDESGPMNLAAEWPITFDELAKKIVEVTKSKSKIVYAKKEDIFAGQPLADISLAKSALGWFPVIMIEQGLALTLDYLSAQEGIKRPEQYGK